MAYSFNLPPLPKPEYEALKQLTKKYQATQLEIMCVGLRFICEALNTPGRAGVNAGDVGRLLREFRETAPSEQAPLLVK